MARERITKAVKDQVLGEYDHLCAVCGATKPQLHHIDEDHSNSIPDNLIPLCPNCHLTDQHDPTKMIPIPILKLFRQYRDPAILKPQFVPIFSRFEFLTHLSENDSWDRECEKQTKRLIDFISFQEMGGAYAREISELLPECPYSANLSENLFEEAWKMSYGRNKKEKVHMNKILKSLPEVLPLIIEMLRYQSWANQVNR